MSHRNHRKIRKVQWDTLCQSNAIETVRTFPSILRNIHSATVSVGDNGKWNNIHTILMPFELQTPPSRLFSERIFTFVNSQH